jgi:hypothetical protein
MKSYPLSSTLWVPELVMVEVEEVRQALASSSLSAWMRPILAVKMASAAEGRKMWGKPVG